MNFNVFLADAVWHIGRHETAGRIFRRAVAKNWDFEFGLLSVSLQPEAWRSGWAGDDGVIYEITAPGRRLCLIDADDALTRHADEIESAAIKAGILTCGTDGIEARAGLYHGLGLALETQLHLETRTFEDQLRQAALAILVSGDTSLDGLWWPDLLNGSMRTARGGLYQHRLDRLDMAIVTSAPKDATVDSQRYSLDL